MGKNESFLDRSVSTGKKKKGKERWKAELASLKPGAGKSRGSGSRFGTKSAVEQFTGRTADMTSENRDVHSGQTFGHTDLGQSKKPWMFDTFTVVATVLFVVLFWLLWGFVGWIGSMAFSASGGADENRVAQVKTASELGVPVYWSVSPPPAGAPPSVDGCYQQINPDGSLMQDRCYNNADSVPQPQWYVDQSAAAFAAAGKDYTAPYDLGSGTAGASIIGWLAFSHASWVRLLVSVGLGTGTGLLLGFMLRKKNRSRNLMTDNSDIHQFDNDNYIELPVVALAKMSVTPDVGAHTPVEASSILGHAYLSNAGIDKVARPVIATEDVVDENGDVVVLKGDWMRSSNGEVITTMEPLFDEEFANKLYDSSNVPENMRKWFDARAIDHNPGGKNRDKVGAQDTLAQHINEEWDLPFYETQRPAGVYFTDPAPVNTMMLAMTRAGKGQTYIEPMIDVWSRENRKSNMLVNDPKGELLVKNFTRLSARGIQPIQFNLINPIKTDIYNPLTMALEAARAGNSQDCAKFVEAIGGVFFPADAGDDPMWQNAANNAFKRAVYGLIDFYLEEERQMRKRSIQEKWQPSVLDNRLDTMWGNVTLFNCYQLFTQLSSRKLPNPKNTLEADLKAGKYGTEGESDPEKEKQFKADMAAAEAKAPFWDNQPEADMLTVFFNATRELPVSTIRQLVGDADASLRAMGGAEKMISSVYGIAITNMSFFTDPTVMRLTSGRPSQNVDLESLSFPRRFAVRFTNGYLVDRRFISSRCIWEAFEDKAYTKPLRKNAKDTKFYHEDIIGPEGWAWCYFEGVFPKETTYLRMRVVSDDNGLEMARFHFKFIKGYKADLRGIAYVTDPVTGKKIVNNGLLVEMTEQVDKKTGKKGFKPGRTMFKENRLNVGTLTPQELHSDDLANKIKPVDIDTPIIQSTRVGYAEQTKALFMVTPPHLMKYAKLILILVKQTFDTNVGGSYLTKASQKPQYKTKYMLDELGNLQSDGNGIDSFGTMLSIGLGQDQQYSATSCVAKNYALAA